MSIDERMRRREEKAIRDINRGDDPHDELYQCALQVLYSLGLLLIGFVFGMYASATRAQAAEKVPVAPRCEYVGKIPESWPEEVLPDAIDGTIHTASEAEQEPAERWESLGKYKLTFYCSCRKCSGKWGHRTSSGATCEEGTTVACAVLPAGTHIWIEGYGERIVQDTGAGVRGKHIDIFMESHSECLKNGVQYKEVRIKR